MSQEHHGVIDITATKHAEAKYVTENSWMQNGQHPTLHRAFREPSSRVTVQHFVLWG